MNFTTELRNYIRARYSIIQLVTHEEVRAVTELDRIAKELNHEIYYWSASNGLMKGGSRVIDRTADLKNAIDYCEEQARRREPHIFVFLDCHSMLGANGNPLYRRRLKDFSISIRTQGYRSNCILLGTTSEVSAELLKEVVLLDFPLLNRELVKDAIIRFIEIHKANPKLCFDVPPLALEQLVEAALGLTLAEIENCLSKALVEELSLNESDVSALLKEKQQLIRKTGILDYIDVAGFSLSSVGGLENLKRWLALRNQAFSRSAKEFGLAPPKGVLLTGVPGCGKSLTAKCVAASWKLPLLKLDMGKVFHGIVGSSEANIRHALNTAEAVAPSILWIDEIEKGLAGAGGGGGDGGTATRVFGTLLTWMQEKTAPVFVFATANDIGSLPPELLRKGRFDEIFFLDLPSQAERQSILSIRLQQKGRNLTQFDMPRLAALSGEAALGESVRLSGAEIEAWVEDALLEAYGRHCEGDLKSDLSMQDLEQTITRIVPMAKMRKADITKLRAWATENAVAASTRDASKSVTSMVTPEPAFTIPPTDATAGRVLDF